MTDRAVAGFDLFRRVEAHYQEHFTREGCGEAFASEVGLVEHVRTGAMLETPAWKVGPRGHLKPRAHEQAVTACLMCLQDELNGHPKPRAAATVLLEKGGLLGRSRGGAAGVAF